MRKRACSIIIRDGKLLFVEQMVKGKTRHVFIGGGIEDGETPQEAVLRELSEEANLQGKIVFGPVVLTSEMREYVFVVSIPDNAEPVIGCDPELPHDKQSLLRIVWIDSQKEADMFNSIDKKFFSAVVSEAEKQGTNGDWTETLKSVIEYSF